MANQQVRSKPVVRRRTKRTDAGGKKRQLHELRGSAYFLLPAEIHALLKPAQLEVLRANLRQQALLLYLEQGRHLVTIQLPMHLMVWPPETGKQKVSGRKRNNPPPEKPSGKPGREGAA